MGYDSVSVVVPAYAQAGHIVATLLAYDDALAGIDRTYEIVVVANGPDDGTYEQCLAAARRRPSIRVERSQPGWGVAIQQGISSSRGDLICYTNSARTSSDDLLAVLLFALANPDVVVKASRKTRDNAYRRLGSLLYNLECRALFGFAHFDVNGTPKAFPRAFEQLLQLRRRDDVIDAEFSAVCHRQHYPVLEVPIVSTRRHGGTSTTRLMSAVHLYWGAYQLWRDDFRASSRG
ncbi:MAG TPA: glycosyltransferase [Acidimicrobiales bacterium]|nr:glycosyltransferase [Acidimicrobiales bacterium]